MDVVREYRTALVHLFFTWWLVYTIIMQQTFGFDDFLFVFFSVFLRFNAEWISTVFFISSSFFYRFSVCVFLSANIKYCLLFFFRRFACCFTFVWCVHSTGITSCRRCAYDWVVLTCIDDLSACTTRCACVGICEWFFSMLACSCDWHVAPLIFIFISIIVTFCYDFELYEFFICAHARSHCLSTNDRRAQINVRTHRTRNTTWSETAAHKRCDIK